MLLYGPDRPAMEQRLMRRYAGGLEIKDVAEYDFATAWKTRALSLTDAVARARAENRPFDFDRHSIWKDLKEFLFDLFNDTCAYCESSLKATSYGAVEHYRPKQLYDWLAFEVSNFLPTCTRCNTSKGTKFPLKADAARATTSAELTGEVPLLLNPYEPMSVSSHIVFVSADGMAPGPIAKGVTDRGTESIQILDLNRSDLVLERLLEQQRAYVEYVTQRFAHIHPIQVLEQLMAGTRPFSAASLAAVSRVEVSLPRLSPMPSGRVPDVRSDGL
jgi:uncharacterized protein (TIGR02646 family)